MLFQAISGRISIHIYVNTYVYKRFGGHYVFMCFLPSFLLFWAPSVTRIRESSYRRKVNNRRSQPNYSWNYPTIVGTRKPIDFTSSLVPRLRCHRWSRPLAYQRLLNLPSIKSQRAVVTS